jgi:hypothetical protein
MDRYGKALAACSGAKYVLVPSCPVWFDHYPTLGSAFNTHPCCALPNKNPDLGHILPATFCQLPSLPWSLQVIQVRKGLAAGGNFYIIQSGSVLVSPTKTPSAAPASKSSMQASRLAAGQYFGEGGLVTDGSKGG